MVGKTIGRVQEDLICREDRLGAAHWIALRNDAMAWEGSSIVFFPGPPLCRAEHNDFCKIFLDGVVTTYSPRVARCECDGVQETRFSEVGAPKCAHLMAAAPLKLSFELLWPDA